MRLLILTDCRLGEIMRVKWDYVDFEGRALRLPDRLHLSQGHRLGLVLPQHDIGRLLALHHEGRRELIEARRVVLRNRRFGSAKLVSNPPLT